MSHRYLLRTVGVEQREEWDRFVSGQTHGHFLQSWGWGEVKESVGWNPLRWVLWDMERQERMAAAQVLCRSAPHLPLRLGHLAYIPKGPVLAWSLQDQAEANHAPVGEALFSQLNAQLRKQGALALQVELPLEAEGEESVAARECMAKMDFHPVRTIQPVRTILLDLSADEETLLAQMKEKWRYNIRLAGRKGVRVRMAQAIKDVRAWYRLLQITSERDRFGIHTFDYYLRAWQVFYPRNQAQLFLAEHDGQLLAGIFVGLMAKRAIYLYGASSNEQRQLMPNYLLQWEAMRWAKGQGATSYDFWGVPETDGEHDPMAGVYRFKSGWGGRIVRFLGNYEHTYHSLAMGLVRRYLPRMGG